MFKAIAACAAGSAAGLYWSQPQVPVAASVSCGGSIKKSISPEEFRKFPLINMYDETPDTKVLRFALPEGDAELGMELASCIVFKYTDKDGKAVIRPYTPITKTAQQGYFEVLVKCYKGSKMGTHLFGMKLGDTIDAKGPFLKFQYKPGMYKHIGMIAGGSGITPMFQLLREVLREKTPPQVNLIAANRRKEDVLLGTEINELMELYPSFAPYFVLSQPPQSWMGGVGHVTKDMIKAFMPAPTRVHDSVVLVCGPPAFMETISGDKDFKSSPPAQGELKGYLKELGYTAKQVYKF